MKVKCEEPRSKEEEEEEKVGVGKQRERERQPSQKPPCPQQTKALGSNKGTEVPQLGLRLTTSNAKR